MSQEDEWKALLDPLHPHDKALVFFALNDNNTASVGGTHWSLIVYSRKEDTFYNYDSMNNFNMTTALKLHRILRKALKSQGDLFLQRCTQQQNAYDCGIHLLSNVENICNFFLRDGGSLARVPNEDISAIQQKRGHILRLIESKILGD